jgi:ribose transport system ATP-binding protein
MTFGDFVALDDVSLELLPGQVHALLGANGSGKSTLVKVMSGVLQPDVGTVELAGVKLPGMGSPAQAAQRGVRVVHQEAPLVDSLSVTEAVALFRGFGASALGRVPWRKLRREVQALLDRMDVPVNAGQLCASIGPADRAGLALAIVMGDQFGGQTGDPEHRVRLLIVDEVTAAIPEQETARHLARLRQVADSGVAVVMVTHRLPELDIADDLTVLRAGRVVHAERGGARIDTTQLVSLMVGHDEGATVSSRGAGTGENRRQPVRQLWERSPAVRIDGRSRAADQRAGGAVRLELAGVTGRLLNSFDLRAKAGEVVGFTGLRQSGVEELPQILTGGSRRTAGTVTIDGQTIPVSAPPSRMIAAGVAGVPADRFRDGGVASLSVEENVVLPALRSYWHRPARRRAAVAGVIEAFDVRPRTAQTLFGALSGGNQQKVLLGKWLALRPRVLVLDDPTYGVDPGAREIIFDAIVDAAAQGVCVLFFSTEPEQLTRVCHRVVIVRDGANATELSGPELTLENLVGWSYR